MTAAVWLAPVATIAGVASGPLLDRAIATSVTRRSGLATAPGPKRIRAAGLSLAIGALECTAVLRIGVTWSLAPIAVFLAGLVALAWCDGEYYLLPKRLQHPTAAVSGVLLLLAALATSHWHELGVAAACGGVAYGAFLVMNFLNPRAMAFGDVRLAGTIGLVVGWFGAARAFEAFAVASVTGAFIALVLLATRRIGLRGHLPYGVFLALGAVVALVA